MQRLEHYEVVAVDAPLSSTEFPEPSPGGDAPGLRERYRRPVEKIREVHDYMRSHPGSAHYLFEVHPRLSFLELQGATVDRPLAQGKPRFRDQLSFLCDIFPAQALHQALTAFRHAEASRNDILDAFAMLWSAKRIATCRAERLPSIPVYDARGFDMAIWY